MRRFSHFLFEAYEPEQAAQNPLDPRRYQTKATDACLSAVADGLTVAEGAQTLMDLGLLRKENGRLLFNSPVFLREDAPVLRAWMETEAARLVDLVEQDLLTPLRRLCGQILNGVSVALNLYHIFCGMILDGAMFDALTAGGALAVSRPHISGLDYLWTVYEDCASLAALSDGLLCSYNRLTDGVCALQSFGDARGIRFDFYRLFRLVEHDDVPPRFQEAATLLACLDALDLAACKALVLRASRALAAGLECEPTALTLLEHFGYARDGKLCVPVYGPEELRIAEEMAAVAIKRLAPAVCEVLERCDDTLSITAVAHGVNRLELHNELYHLLFGAINEALVSRGLVAAPQDRPEEGRYEKSVQISEPFCP